MNHKVGPWIPKGDRWLREYIATGNKAAEVFGDGRWQVWLPDGTGDSGLPDIRFESGAARRRAGMERSDAALHSIPGVELDGGVPSFVTAAPESKVREWESERPSLEVDFRARRNGKTYKISISETGTAIESERELLMFAASRLSKLISADGGGE